MTTVRIDRFRHRTVLPASVARQQAGPPVERSLDALLSLLPAVIDDIGLPPSTVVCVRSLRVRLSIGTQELTDVALLAQRWAESIAGSIESACSSSGTSGAGVAESADGDVVVFRNQAAALADLVQCVAFGDRRRQWAWQQAGLLAGDPEDPAALLVTACLQAPGHALPVLGWAATRRLLDRVVLTWPDWHRLAAGLMPGYASTPALPLEPHPDDPAMLVLPPAVQGALTASGLAPALRNSARRFGAPDGQIRLAITALALRLISHHVAGADPARLSTAELRSAAAALFTSAWPEARMTRPEPPASSTPSSEPGDQEWESARAGAPAGAASPVREVDAPPLTSRDESAPVDVDTRPLAEQVAVRESTDVWTARAGLLFVLNLAALQPIVAQAREHERGLQWCLLALGARLAAGDQADAAVRVFAGLPAGVPLAAELTAPPSADGEQLLDDWVASCDAELAVRLLGDGEPEDPPEFLRRNVIRRSGRLLIDPGWIEAELLLDTVDVAIRRAGLDLDPGAVQHLGCVVRFRYV